MYDSLCRKYGTSPSNVGFDTADYMLIDLSS